MSAHIGWPDVVIAVVLLIAALKGYKRGFVMEIAGAVAVIAALITPWFYSGRFDRPIASGLHVTIGLAHVLAMAGVGIATYLAIMLIGRAISLVAKLPVIGCGNAIGGAAIGLAKGAVAIWIVLFLALLFPIPGWARTDLHGSYLARLIASPNASVDKAIRGTLPVFARPFTDPIFDRQRL